MLIKRLLVDLGKLLLCGVLFDIGMVIGGMVASLLKLQPPAMPPGIDMSTALAYMMLTAPLLALALAIIAPGLSGNFVTRALVLAFFMWISYTVNTQLEASIVSTYAQGIWFALVDYLVPSLLVGAVVALLFRPEANEPGLLSAVSSFFRKRPVTAWAWRLPVAAVVFMPIYFVFGLMVNPFTMEYYRQSMFGLVMPTIESLLPILFIRSVLFLLACLPIFILWQKNMRSLFWRLGLALFLLVGFVFMLTSTWLPPYVRIPHTLEILADEFVYAAVLVVCIGVPRQKPSSHGELTVDGAASMASDHVVG